MRCVRREACRFRSVIHFQSVLLDPLAVPKHNAGAERKARKKFGKMKSASRRIRVIRAIRGSFSCGFSLLSGNLLNSTKLVLFRIIRVFRPFLLFLAVFRRFWAFFGHFLMFLGVFNLA